MFKYFPNRIPRIGADNNIGRYITTTMAHHALICP